MRHFGSFVVAVLILGACGPAAPTASVPAPVSSGATVPVSVGSPAAAAPLAAFMGTTLTDVRSGEQFTLADYRGKVAIVEGVAVW